MPKLIIKREDILIRKLLIPAQIAACTIGSDQGNDIIIEDESISMFHFQLEKEDEKYFLRDLLSHSGTYLNGKKIKDRTPLRNFDEISVGNHTIVFEHLETEPGPRHLMDNYELDDKFISQNIEDKIANVPSLTNLNAFLNQESGPSLNNEHDKPDNAEDLNGESLLEMSVQPPPFSQDAVLAIPSNATRPESENLPELFVDEPPELLVDEPPDLLVEEPPESSAEDSPEVLAEDPPELLVEEPPKKIDLTYYLLGIYGPYRGRKFRLKKNVTRIGRDRKRSDILIRKDAKGNTDYAVSRNHAIVKRKGNEFYILDKKSRGGTFVNNKRVEKYDEILLSPGDEIEITRGRRSHIFRLIEQGNWDASPPRKAGPWYVRHPRAFVNILSLVLLFWAAFFLFHFLQKRASAAKTVNLRVVDEGLWYKDELSSGINKSPAFDANSGHSLADINDDHYLDVVFVDKDDYIKIIDGKTRDLFLFKSAYQASPDIPITLVDLNSNGKPDILVVTKELRLQAIEGNTGIELWRSPILASPLTGPPVVADLNGDRLQDVAIASRTFLYVGYGGLRRMRWTKINCGVALSSMVSAVDLTGSGRAKLIVGTLTGNLLIVDGVQKRIIQNLNLRDRLNTELAIRPGRQAVYASVAVGDLQGDRIPDFVVETLDGHLVAIDSRRLTPIWKDEIGAISELGLSPCQNLSLGDLDGDENADVVVLTRDGLLRAWKGAGQNGHKKILWEQFNSEAAPFTGPPILADLDFNGTADVLTYDQQGVLYLFEGADGRLLWQSHTNPAPVKGLPLIGDVDRDGHLDLLALRDDGNYYRYATNRVMAKSGVVWGQLAGNAAHSGLSPYVQPVESSYYVYMTIAAFLFIAAFAINIGYRKNTRSVLYL
ncbi:MAG: FHA domain-containing protein [bacterium]